MELIRHNLALDFMKYRHLFLVVSLSIMIASVVTWVKSGDEKYGVDFLGGVEIVAKFSSEIDLAKLRATVEEKGLSGAVVQEFERGSHQYSIRAKASEQADAKAKMLEAVSALSNGQHEILKEDVVGPLVGGEIRAKGTKAMVIALIGMLIYITLRFEFRFALGAIAALVHDVVVTAGVYVFSGREVDSAIIAALLTIVGYSVNDTIVIYDRIRENLKKALRHPAGKGKAGGAMSLADVMNVSMNETLSRTIITSLTVLFVVLTLFLYGGGAVENLAFALLIGVVAGCYSTIFIANPVVLFFERSRKK